MNDQQTALTSKAHIPKEYMSTAVVTLATAEVDEGKKAIVQSHFYLSALKQDWGMGFKT